MCFSAQASFISSSVLTVVGVAAVKKAGDKKTLPLAILPLIFAFQQLIEGLLWITLPETGAYKFSILTYVFLLVAQFFWPVWVPFAFYKAEVKSTNVAFLSFLVAVGGLASLINLWQLIFNFPLAQIKQNHIHYFVFELPFLKNIGSALYVVSTLLPAFIASIKGSKLLGLCLVFSFLISYFVYAEFMVSVWCYFAAPISLILYYSVSEEKTETLSI